MHDIAIASEIEALFEHIKSRNLNPSDACGIMAAVITILMGTDATAFYREILRKQMKRMQ